MMCVHGHTQLSHGGTKVRLHSTRCHIGDGFYRSLSRVSHQSADGLQVVETLSAIRVGRISQCVSATASFTPGSKGHLGGSFAGGTARSQTLGGQENCALGCAHVIRAPACLRPAHWADSCAGMAGPPNPCSVAVALTGRGQRCVERGVPTKCGR